MENFEIFVIFVSSQTKIWGSKSADPQKLSQKSVFFGVFLKKSPN